MTPEELKKVLLDGFRAEREEATRIERTRCAVIARKAAMPHQRIADESTSAADETHRRIARLALA